VGILPGEELPPSFLPSLLHIRAMGRSQGLSDHSYRIAVGHFSPSNPPKGLWLLDRVKEVEGIAMGVTRSMARERMASGSYIDSILELEAAAQADTDRLRPLALPFAFPCLGRPQTAPIVRCSHPSGCLREPLVEGIGRGNIWPYTPPPRALRAPSARK
jgi:hypothetical protein